jgi:uncharacterized protein (TIGR02246 family)
MRRTALAFFVAAWSFAATTFAALYPNDPLPPDLLKASQEFDKAQIESDKAVLERILGDELFLIGGSGKVETKNDFVRDFTAPGFKLDPFTISEVVQKVRGNYAILGGVVLFKGTDGGKPFAQRIRFSDHWEKRNGKWQVVYIQVTRLPLTDTTPQASHTESVPNAEKAAIQGVIAKMQDSWNHGDFRGYMQGFENPDVVFVSGGKFQSGWQGTLDHYVRDYGASVEKRGTLKFYDIQIEMLAPDAAQLISRYQLIRPEHPQYGINTRLMRKVNGQWVIALNHVSSSETPPEQAKSS